MTNIDTETSRISHRRPSWSNLLASWKFKLQKWVREEIVDDDPWDEEGLMSNPDQLDSKNSSDFPETNSIE